jgi:hypothetical protein
MFNLKVLAAAVAVLRDLQARAGVETGVPTAQLKQHFAQGREQAEAALQQARALDAKLDAVAREQAQAVGRQLAALKEELEGHAAMQGEFTSQWLQQQASQLNAIGAAVERILQQQQQQQHVMVSPSSLSHDAGGAATASAGAHAAGRRTMTAAAAAAAAESVDDLRAAFDEFSTTVSE